jgi:hypothetical protein
MLGRKAGMQDLMYAAADGLLVVLPARTWDHIHQRHPEVTVADIERALTSPVKISYHRLYREQQIYEGAPGTTRHGPCVFPVVIVARVSAQVGVVVTARVSRRPYNRGDQRWP